MDVLRILPITPADPVPRSDAAVIRWLVPAGCVVLGVAGVVWAARSGAEQLHVPVVTSWWWVVVALVSCAASFWAAASAVLAVTPVGLSHGAVVATQVAASATRLVTPASLGLVGLNARLLQSRGARLPVAVTAIAGGQLAQAALTVAALPVILLASGVRLPLPSITSHAAHGVVAGIALGSVAVATLFATAPGRRVLGRARAQRALLEPLSVLVRSPRRVLLMVVGATGVTVSLSLCLYACARALGGDVGLAATAVVLLVGTTLGSALPTPGGVGGVEGAMVAAFLAVGVQVETAVPVVLAFRAVTFWLPAPFGLVALIWLRRQGHLSSRRG